MTYTSDAANPKHQSNEQLISSFAIAIFILVSIVIMIALYPENMLFKQALSEQKPHPIALYYDQQLIQHAPKNNALRIALIKQQIGSNDWQGGKQQLAILLRERNPAILDQAHWLQYRLDFSFAYHLALKDPQRKLSLQYVKNEAMYLMEKKLDAAQLEQLGSDLLGLELPGDALKVYLRLVVFKPKDLNLFAQIAKVALYAGNYLVSGNYYFLIAQQITDIKAKRQYIITGLKAYQAGSLLNEGLSAVEKFPSSVINDEKVLDFLVNYALAANRPDIAQKYVQQSLSQ